MLTEQVSKYLGFFMILEAVAPGFGLSLVVKLHLPEENFSKSFKCQKSVFMFTCFHVNWKVPCVNLYVLI